jgi:hypothetical protein
MTPKYEEIVTIIPEHKILNRLHALGFLDTILIKRKTLEPAVANNGDPFLKISNKFNFKKMLTNFVFDDITRRCSGVQKND